MAISDESSNKVKDQIIVKCVICNEDFICKEKLIEHVKIAHAVRKLLEYDSYGTIRRAAEKETHKFISEVNTRNNKRASLLENSQIILNNLKKENDSGSAIETASNASSSTTKENEVIDTGIIKKPKRKHECVYCAKELENKVQLTKHLQLHEISVQDKKCFKCKQCNESFNELTRLFLHVRSVHDKQESHSCPKCTVICTSLRSLRAHMHVHDKARAGPGYVPHKKGGYECLTCGLVLANRTSVGAHFARHSQARPFACSRCTATFKTKSALGQHVATQHEPLRYPCPACDRIFNYKCTLLQHLSTHIKKPTEK